MLSGFGQLLALSCCLVLAAACSEPEKIRCESIGSAGTSGPASFQVTALAASGSVLWAGTQDGAVRIDMSDSSWTRYTTAEGLAHARVAAVTVDGDGNVWFGYGNQSALTRHSPGTQDFRTYQTGDSSLVDDRIFSLTTSPTGVAWAGTYSGAAILGSSSFGTWLDYHDCLNPGSHCTPIWSYTLGEIAFSPDQTGWFAVDFQTIGVQPKPGGVARRMPDGRTDTWDMSDGLPSNQAKCITLAGEIPWVGSPDGVAVYRPDQDAFEPVSDHNARDIVVDDQGDIWVASPKGAHHRSSGAWSSWEESGCLLAHPVNALEVLGTSVCFGTPAGVGCYDRANDAWSYPYQPE